MTVYTIHGQYPDYVVTADDDTEDTMSDFRTVMRWFISRLEPGDTIHWKEQP